MSISRVGLESRLESGLDYAAHVEGVYKDYLSEYFLGDEGQALIKKLHDRRANKRQAIFEAGSEPRKVTIIGGGPGGLAAAFNAYREGQDVYLAEKRTEYSRKNNFRFERKTFDSISRYFGYDDYNDTSDSSHTNVFEFMRDNGYLAELIQSQGLELFSDRRDGRIFSIPTQSLEILLFELAKAIQAYELKQFHNPEEKHEVDEQPEFVVERGATYVGLTDAGSIKIQDEQGQEKEIESDILIEAYGGVPKKLAQVLGDAAPEMMSVSDKKPYVTFTATIPPSDAELAAEIEREQLFTSLHQLFTVKMEQYNQKEHPDNPLGDVTIRDVRTLFIELLSTQIGAGNFNSGAELTKGEFIILSASRLFALVVNNKEREANPANAAALRKERTHIIQELTQIKLPTPDADEHNNTHTVQVQLSDADRKILKDPNLTDLKIELDRSEFQGGLHAGAIDEHRLNQFIVARPTFWEEGVNTDNPVEMHFLKSFNIQKTVNDIFLERAFFDLKDDSVRDRIELFVSSITIQYNLDLPEGVDEINEQQCLALYQATYFKAKEAMLSSLKQQKFGWKSNKLPQTRFFPTIEHAYIGVELPPALYKKIKKLKDDKHIAEQVDLAREEKSHDHDDLTREQHIAKLKQRNYNEADKLLIEYCKLNLGQHLDQEIIEKLSVKSLSSFNVAMLRCREPIKKSKNKLIRIRLGEVLATAHFFTGSGAAVAIEEADAIGKFFAETSLLSIDDPIREERLAELALVLDDKAHQMQGKALNRRSFGLTKTSVFTLKECEIKLQKILKKTEPLSEEEVWDLKKISQYISKLETISNARAASHHSKLHIQQSKLINEYKELLSAALKRAEISQPDFLSVQNQVTTFREAKAETRKLGLRQLKFQRLEPIFATLRESFAEHDQSSDFQFGKFLYDKMTILTQSELNELEFIQQCSAFENYCRGVRDDENVDGDAYIALKKAVEEVYSPRVTKPDSSNQSNRKRRGSRKEN